MRKVLYGFLCASFMAGSAAAAGPAGQLLDLSKLEHATTAPDAPVVYYSRQITPEAMLKLYAALGRPATGKVAVKLSTGEAGNNHYLSPALIAPLVKSINGTIVECNTAYGGSRADTQSHRKVIKDHGFDAIAPVDIMDEEGSMSIPVKQGQYLKEDLVGSHLANYDFMAVLSHFKGHAMGGFGGALKNISIGVASSQGKHLIHSAGHTTENAWTYQDGAYATYTSPEKLESPQQLEFIKSMAEAAKAVSDYEGEGQRMLYISVLNHLSVDCDCNGNPAAPDMHDIGIIASTDAVAIDQAGVDLVWLAPDSGSLKQRMDSRHGRDILEYAQSLGLGKTNYRIVDIDAQ